MPRLQAKSFSTPDSVRTTPNVRFETISLDEATVGHCRFEPGWRWSTEFGTQLGRLDLAAFAQAVGASYLPLDGDAAATLGQALRNDGVTIVEVSLCDSAGQIKLRAAGAAREAMRSLVPAAMLARLKRWIR